MLEGTTDQDVPIAPGNRITPLGQDHARQEAGRTLVQNHLALDRLHRQRQAQRAQQLTAPRTCRQHDLIAEDRAIGRVHAHHTGAVQDKPATSHCS
jgi:hypothetical protein